MPEKLWNKITDYMPAVIGAICVFVIGFLLIKLIINLMKRGMKKSKADRTAKSFIVSVVQTALYVLVVICVLSALKVPMTSIVAAVGAAGVAIALAVQNSLSNVAGGFIILFTQPFKCNDYVKINGYEGSVTSISILYTKLLTFDNKAVLIPNGTVTTSSIINYSHEEFRRLDMKFKIDYNCDFHKAMELIADVVKNNTLNISVREDIIVDIEEFCENGIVLMLKAWIYPKDYWNLYYYVNSHVKDAFDKNNITLPYQKHTINLKETPDNH